MWIWPLRRFWTYTPQGWVLAIAWNVSEYLGVSMPFAPQVFSVITGCKGKRIK